MRRRISVALAALLVLAGCGGSDDEAEPEGPAPETSSTATTGDLVDVGGRSLYLHCQGSGSPVVVLEAGLAGDSRTWGQVAPEIAADTTVCAYDRANLGQSEPAETPRTAQDMVGDLEALLQAAGQEPPLVLVGFSFGGVVAQMYASTHASDVAGIVLVESNHPDEVKEFEAHLTPAQVREDRAVVQDNAEGVDIYTSFDQARSVVDLPQVPLVVVTAGLPVDWPPGWDQKTFERLRAQEQKDLAAMVPGGRQVVAEASGHDVPNEQPDVVIDAIRDVLAEAG